MGPVFQVIAVVLPWFVHLHSIRGKIIMKDKGAISSCVHQRQSWFLMRPNKATKERIHYFQVLGQDLSLKPDSVDDCFVV
jgi:hypothetical protein